MTSCMITGEEFEALLDRRITLRKMCEDGQATLTELEQVENEIEEQLRIEREAEQI